MASSTAIFWDYENVPLPNTSIKATDASKGIVEAVAKYDTQIIERKLYFDVEKADMNSGSTSLWSDLSSNGGFTIVNTPRRGQKETLDKTLIADMMAFAWDLCSTDKSSKPSVVLISGDGDYAYTLHKLKDRGVRTILIHGKDARLADDLKAIADVTIGSLNDILQNRAVESRSEENAVILRKIIVEEVLKDNSKHEDGWILASMAADLFHNKIGSESFTRKKAVYKEARELAIQKGWLEWGKRRAENPRKGEIVNTNLKGPGHSLEDFLRVISLPGIGSERSKPSADMTTKLKLSSEPSNFGGTTRAAADGAGVSTRLFVKNAPSSITIFGLVEFLKTKHGISLAKACPVDSYFNKEAPYRFFCVETESKEDAWKLICISKDQPGLLSFGNRQLEILQDREKNSYKRWDKHRTYVRGDIEKDIAERESTAAFCKIIRLLANGGSWVKCQTVEAWFQSHMHEGVRDRCTLVWQDALRKDYIVFGSGRAAYITPTSPPNSIISSCGDDVHVCLTQKGTDMVRMNTADLSSSWHDRKRKNDTWNVFIKGLPVSVTGKEIVDYLEGSHSVTVKRACIDPIKPGHQYGAAHVEFLTSSDSTKVLQLASKNELVYDDRSLTACSDQNIPYWPSVPNNQMYEQAPLPAAIYAEETLAPSTITPEYGQDVQNMTLQQQSSNAHAGNLPFLVAATQSTDAGKAGNAPPFSGNATDLLLPYYSNSATDLLWSNPMVRLARAGIARSSRIAPINELDHENQLLTRQT